MELCQKYTIHLVSDESFALSVWAPESIENHSQFCSVLAINMDGIINPSLVHVLWGLSKASKASRHIRVPETHLRSQDFGLNGLRMGCIISQENPSFLAAISEIS